MLKLKRRIGCPQVPTVTILFLEQKISQQWAQYHWSIKLWALTRLRPGVHSHGQLQGRANCKYCFGLGSQRTNHWSGWPCVPIRRHAVSSSFFFSEGVIQACLNSVQLERAANLMDTLGMETLNSTTFPSLGNSSKTRHRIENWIGRDHTRLYMLWF